MRPLNSQNVALYRGSCTGRTFPVFLLAVSLLFGAGIEAKAQSLDFEFYRTRVEPIFLKKRPGLARCYVCHSANNTGLRLQPLPRGATSWTEEQSRRNFQSVSQLVVPGDPLSSRLLMHPLAHAAGGDPFHGGGQQFASQNDPDWQAMAEWVRRAGTGGSAGQSTTSGESLDFGYYRAHVEPMFLKQRENGAMCYNCHSVINTRLRLERLSPGRTFWTQEQSRRNFEAVARLVTPGEPLKSRLLLHPLAVEAGGDPMHTGGKFWKSQADPEWQMLAEWVRSGHAPEAASSPPAPALDYEFFKTRVEPIFLKKRPGLARCYVCHSANNTGLRLERLAPGATFWTEEQSRRNFQSVSQLVVPGDPLSSRLLMHPLAHSAGGDPFHGGGQQFASQNDPDWQVLAEWVRGQKATISSK